MLHLHTAWITSPDGTNPRIDIVAVDAVYARELARGHGRGLCGWRRFLRPEPRHVLSRGSGGAA